MIIMCDIVGVIVVMEVTVIFIVRVIVVVV